MSTNTGTEVVIVSATRTPVGSFCGALSSLKAHELGSIAIKEALRRAGIGPDEVDEVIMGQVLTAGQGQNPGRQAAIKAGIPFYVPAYTINMLCGSGLKAVMVGFQSIRNHDASVVVCGGQESMSQAPHVMNLRSGIKMGNKALSDSMLSDGLTDAFYNIHMGETAEIIAEQEHVTRDQQDEFALRSQHKVEAAKNNKYFDEEIVPVTLKSAKSETVVAADEYPRSGLKIEDLHRLKPVFKKDGTVTPGNASGINDGAAALVLMSSKKAKAKGVCPLAKIISIAQVGIDPKLMGLGPVSAIKNVIQAANWKSEDVDLFELNEAFAAQSIAVIKHLQINPDKINISGGAISLGHPIGASGARVLVTLLHNLKRIGGKKGVAALCVGGGMATAMCVEMC